MKIISKYIFKQIALVFCYITLFFISLIWLMISLKFIEYITNNGLDFLSFVSMTSLLMPTMFPFLTPITLALSCIFVYHKLSTDNELIIIKASGLNKFQILFPTILFALIITLLNLFLNLYISPLSKETFKQNQKELRENIARIAFKEGSFSTVFSNITIYVEEIIDANNFSKIFVYDQRNKKNPATYIAEQAELIQEKGVNKVILKKGNRQFINQKDLQLNIISFDKYEVNLDLLMKKDDARIKEPEEMMLKELWSKKHKSSGQYEPNQINSMVIEGHKRIINPIYCIIFVLISLTFLISDKLVVRSSTKKISWVLLSIFLLEILYLSLPNFLIKKPELVYFIYIIPLSIILFLLICNISKTTIFLKK